MQKVNVQDKLAQIHDHWNPRIIAELNGQHVKAVKFQGEFVWHNHSGEDELFYVVRGSFRMELEGQSIEIKEGEFLVVPRGVDHRPVADNEVEVLLFEPAQIRHTGQVVDERTVTEFQWL